MAQRDSRELNEAGAEVQPLGGADAVEKTTYAGDARGAEPNDPRDGKTPYSAIVPAGRGMGLLAWATAILAIAALIAYLIGVF